MEADTTFVTYDNTIINFLRGRKHFLLAATFDRTCSVLLWDSVLGVLQSLAKWAS